MEYRAGFLQFVVGYMVLERNADYVPRFFESMEWLRIENQAPLAKHPGICSLPSALSMARWDGLF